MDDLKDMIKELKADTKAIRDKIECFPCKVHTFQISLLQKIVFGAVSLVLLGFLAKLTGKI